MADTLQNESKIPETDHDLHSLIAKRWSPRAFADQAIADEQLLELFEAARWAASANNEQPWLYTYAHKGTPGFDQLLDGLAPGNQPWAKDAAALAVCCIRTNFATNGNPNPWAAHDLGLANAQLLIQAAHRDIYGHMMAGFDKDKISKLLDLSEEVKPICMMALGYLGNPDDLIEPYQSRELAERKRLPLDAIAKAL